MVALDDLRIRRRRSEMPGGRFGAGAVGRARAAPQVDAVKLLRGRWLAEFAQGVFDYAHVRTSSAWS